MYQRKCEHVHVSEDLQPDKREHISCTCGYVMIQVASLASATFVCTLGREQQYFLNAKGQIWDQPRSAISASLAPPSWRRCWLAA